MQIFIDFQYTVFTVLRMEEKVCSKCKCGKPISAFYTDKKSKDGYAYDCRDCVRVRAKAHHDANIGSHREKMKAHYWKTKDYNNAKCKEYRKAHKDEIREGQKRWLALHPEHNKERYERDKFRILERQRKYRAKNRAKKNAQAKTYREANQEKVAAAKLKSYNKLRQNSTEFRLLCALRCRLRSAVKGIVKSARTIELLGCTVDALMVHLEKQFKPEMSWGNYGKWEVDHIKPCAAFDMADHGQQRACFHWSNLQPLWKLDNILKSDSTSSQTPEAKSAPTAPRW